MLNEMNKIICIIVVILCTFHIHIAPSITISCTYWMSDQNKQEGNQYQCCWDLMFTFNIYISRTTWTTFMKFHPRAQSCQHFPKEILKIIAFCTCAYSSFSRMVSFYRPVTMGKIGLKSN